jgi:nitroreductase
VDLTEAILSRKSIRAFREEPVPQKVLKEILRVAICAPSWTNMQPWEFVIVGGKKLQELKQALATKVDEAPCPDIHRPADLPEPYGTRRSALMAKILETKGIDRENREKRQLWNIHVKRFFEAPDAIIICMDRSIYFIEGTLNVWALFSCGLVAMNIVLLATNYGLGTCIEYVPVLHPNVIRDVLEIPNSKLIVLTVAIGVPNWDDPVNQFRSSREPLESIVKWCGFN